VKRQKVSSQIERQILIAMITSKEFLQQSNHIMDLSLIDIPHFNRIAGWCKTYFQKYKEAPRKNIETTFHSWEESLGDKDDGKEAESIASLLQGLSDQYDDHDPINVPYLLDQLRNYLERKSLAKLQEEVDFAMHSGHQEDAKAAILDFRPIELQTSNGIDPLRDIGAWERAFSESAKPLFEFPGAAGIFLNNAFTRDSLIGIQAPEKRGKTFWCIEFVVRALRERCKVAFFQVGDLSENQVMLRLGMYFAQRPSLEYNCGTFEIPTKINVLKKSDKTDDEEDGFTTDTETKIFSKPLTHQACIKSARRFMLGCGLNKDKSYLKVSVHPNSSINVKGITTVLDKWEMSEGFIPDVIVIDYADILAPEDAKENTRDQVNTTWKALRRLSQEKHCLVIVPTQADAGSYNIETQSMKNFSEDKRKFAHVTGMIGLNQTPLEKSKSVMRLNWLVLRESPFDSNKCLWVGQCLAIGRAYYCASL
jgi:hypothetical protein